MPNRWAAGAMAAVAAAAVAGCGDSAMSCTLIGCGPALVVQFEPPLIEEGRWTLAASDGAAMGHCVIDVPTSQTQSCINYQGDAPIVIEPRRDDGAGLAGFEIHAEPPPPSVTISVARSDLVVAEMTVSIDYEVSHPNGPDCGTCYDGGTVVLEIPAD